MGLKGYQVTVSQVSSEPFV